MIIRWFNTGPKYGLLWFVMVCSIFSIWVSEINLAKLILGTWFFLLLDWYLFRCESFRKNVDGKVDGLFELITTCQRFSPTFFLRRLQLCCGLLRFGWSGQPQGGAVISWPWFICIQELESTWLTNVSYRLDVSKNRGKTPKNGVVYNGNPY